MPESRLIHHFPLSVEKYLAGLYNNQTPELPLEAYCGYVKTDPWPDIDDIRASIGELSYCPECEDKAPVAERRQVSSV